MTNSQRLSAVRNAIRQWISQRCDEELQSDRPLSEAILIRDGYFCGRRFRFRLHSAVWFLEEDEVKICDVDGNVVERIGSDQIELLADQWRERGGDVPDTLSIVTHRENLRASSSPELTAQAKSSRDGVESEIERDERRAA